MCGCIQQAVIRISIVVLLMALGMGRVVQRIVEAGSRLQAIRVEVSCRWEMLIILEFLHN